MRPIAHIHSDFSTKFGIPRQSGVVESLQAEIVFAPEFRSREAVRGSCVRLERVDLTDPRGPVLHVAGADLMDGTPIFDIKPYVAYADCHPEATEGFTGQVAMQELTVTIPPEQLSRFPADKRDALIGVLTQDPRPRYQTDASRVYGLEFGGYEIKFRVDSQTLTVTDIAKKDS